MSRKKEGNGSTDQGEYPDGLFEINEKVKRSSLLCSHLPVCKTCADNIQVSLLRTAKKWGRGRSNIIARNDHKKPTHYVFPPKTISETFMRQVFWLT